MTNMGIAFENIFMIEVSCEDNEPVFETSKSKYIIEDICYENLLFHLFNVEVLDSKCIAPLQFFSFDRFSFRFGPNFVNLYLFYDCNNSFPIDYTQHPISCFSNASIHSYVVLETGKDSINCDAMPCQSYVAAPVELEGGQQNQTLETIDYTTLLKNGFTLERSTAISCAECNRSGGRCGFTNDTLCFCPDGPHRKHCNHGTFSPIPSTIPSAQKGEVHHLSWSNPIGLHWDPPEKHDVVYH
ncbi:unnamed protein product [Ilex paraguariensis]|uniref:Wall-associated receptor kinase C-terminal domain-containing protein n=1 Tax=Ilex paraguariensis TaxID=185542 RepID=A0ABC8S368_9AQUA